MMVGQDGRQISKFPHVLITWCPDPQIVTSFSKQLGLLGRAIMLESISPSEGSSFALSKWEAAGESLSNTLSAYLASCVFLEKVSPKSGVEAQQLATRIDISLDNLHKKLADELAQSRVILARMRNKSLSMVYRLPNEIVSKIFMDVVYSPAPDDQRNPSMLQSLDIMFGRLYKLLSVCSAWRDTGTALNRLWLFVPVSSNSRGHPTHEATSFILERSRALTSGDRPLHLAAILSRGFDSDIPLVGWQAPQFTSINIESEFDGLIAGLLKKLLGHRSHLTLSELSIHHARHEHDHLTIRLPSRFITSNMPAKHDSFIRLIASLSVLRVKGANFPWDRITFSNKLVELRLQSVVLGQDSQLIGLLKTLRRAPELQVLTIISVVACPSRLMLTPPSGIVSFPKLRSLLLEDLDYHVLHIVLSSISPGLHRSKILLNSKCRQVYQFDDEPMEISMNFIYGSLRYHRVDTLLLLGDPGNTMWLDAMELRSILECLPALRALKMCRWKLRTQDLLALKRPHSENIHPRPFPNLEHLCLVDCSIWDPEELSSLVSSHPLQTMELGGDHPDEGNDDDSDIIDLDPSPSPWDALANDDHIVQQLRTMVPDFRLVESSEIEDFNQHVWRLW